MTLTSLLIITVILLVTTSCLLTFRHRLVPFIAEHPNLSKIVAISLAAILFILAAAPFIAFFMCGD